MGMEEKAAVAELRQMVRGLSKERQRDFADAYNAIIDYHAAHGDLGIIAMQVFVLEQAE